MCCSSLPHTGRSQLGRITGSYSANGSYSAVIFKECFDLNSGFCHKLIELCWMELFGSFMALLIDLFASGSVHVNNMLATSSKDRAWLTSSMDHCFLSFSKIPGKMMTIMAKLWDAKYSEAIQKGQRTCPWPYSKCSKTVEVRCSC